MNQVNKVKIIQSILLIPVIVPMYLLIIFLISHKSEYDEIKSILINHINVFNSSYIIDLSVISNTSNCSSLDKDISQEWSELVFGEVEKLCDDEVKLQVGCGYIDLNTIFNRKICILKGNSSYSYANLIEKYSNYVSNEDNSINKTQQKANFSIMNEKLISFDEMNLSNEKRLFSNILQSNVDISLFFNKESIASKDGHVLYELILIDCIEVREEVINMYRLIYNFTEYGTCLYGMYTNSSLIKSFSIIENLIYDIKLNETSYFPYIKTKDFYESIDFVNITRNTSSNNLTSEISQSQYQSLDDYQSLDLYSRPFIKSMFYSSVDIVNIDKSNKNSLKSKLILSDFLSQEQILSMNTSNLLDKKNISVSFDTEVSLIYSMYPRVVSSVGFIDLKTHLSYFSYIITLENALLIQCIVFVLVLVIDFGLIIKRISPHLLIAIEILLIVVSLCIIISLFSYIQYFEIYSFYISLSKITNYYYSMYDEYIQNYIFMVKELIFVLMFFNLFRIIYSLIRLYIGIRLFNSQDASLLNYFNLIDSVYIRKDNEESKKGEYKENIICNQQEIQLKKNN